MNGDELAVDPGSQAAAAALCALPGVVAGPAVVAQLAALDAAMRAGHTCLAVEDPTVVAALWASGLVGADADAGLPYVLDGRTLFTRRYWRYEAELAAQLRRRAAGYRDGAGDPAVTADIAQCFPPRNEALVDGVDWQRLACCTAMARSLAVISGGPGSGKTTVAGAVVAVAARAQARFGPPLEVVIAAPTGKAAQRLRESLADTGQQLIARGLLTAAELARLTGQVATLHRLLFDRRVGLADLVVIDEVSMADVATLARVLERIGQQSRVLLLGDPEQLASVEAGRVLGDLAERAVDGTAADIAAAYRASDPQASPPPVVDAPALSLCQVRLRKNWRAADAPSICTCARLVQEQPAAVAPLLDDPAHAEAAGLRDTRSGRHPVFAERVALPVQPRALHAALWARWADRLRALAAAADPAAALAQLDGWRLLTALRRGPYGSEEINRRFEERLRPESALARADGHFHGRPLLVTRNDHDCRLYNGDIGIVWQDAEGLAAHFPRSEGGLRRINLHRLASATGAYALSTHKSQGSQFGHVELVLCPPPPRGARSESLLARELLYTAITRARYSVRIWGDRELLAAMAGRRTRRVSGLARFLEEGRAD